MASPEVLDFQRLLSPIPGDNPAGEALRLDLTPTAVYHVLKGARNTARAAERTAAWDAPSPENRPDWQPILKLAPDVLADRSKDIEVTAWLIEALVRKHGFAGLRDGWRLARELVERFWDSLYPMPDEDGVATRVAPLAGFSGVEAEGTLVRPILAVPLTAGQDGRALGTSDYRQALDLEQVADPDKRAQRLAQGAVSLAMFEQSVAETPPELLTTLRDDLAQCCERFEKLDRVLEEKCGRDASGYSLAPASSNLRNTLQSCGEVLASLIHESPAAAAATATPGSTAPSATFGAAGRIETRKDAFRMLLAAAQFFKQSEPHSPVSYLLEQAVRWGRLPLPELLSELIPEEAVRGQLFKLVGIRPLEKSQ